MNLQLMGVLDFMIISDELKNRIVDPIHGIFTVDDTIYSIIMTPIFQRLKRIKQLSGANWVYPSAEHSRFGHSIGAMYIANLWCSHLLKNYEDHSGCELARLSALLHDVGHGPFSHVFEELLIPKKNFNHEEVTRRFIRESEISDILTDAGFSPRKIADMATGKIHGSFEGAITSIVAGQIDADKMDYIARDSHYCGVEYGLIDTHRLILNSEINEDGYIIQYNLKAKGAIESFLVARYELFFNVYYHKTVRAVEIMLVELFEYLDEIFGLTDYKIPDEYARLDDEYIMALAKSLKNDTSTEGRKAFEVFSRLNKRKLYKPAFQKVVETTDDFVSKVLSSPNTKELIKKKISEDANVPSDVIWVDIPTLPMIPYDQYQENPFEIPVFRILDVKERINFSDYSSIAKVMQGYLDIIRVFTLPQYRADVLKSSRKVFGELPETANIHM